MCVSPRHVRLSLIGNSPVRNPARDPNLARVQTAMPTPRRTAPQVRKQDDRRPPPKFLTGFCSLPHFAPAICIPHFSLPSVRPSSLFPSALSNVRHTRERVSFANAFGDDGAEEEVYSPPFRRSNFAPLELFEPRGCVDSNTSCNNKS